MEHVLFDGVENFVVRVLDQRAQAVRTHRSATAVIRTAGGEVRVSGAMLAAANEHIGATNAAAGETGEQVARFLGVRSPPEGPASRPEVRGFGCGRARLDGQPERFRDDAELRRRDRYPLR